MEPEYQYILEKLGIAPDAQVVREYPIIVGDRELLVDIAVKSRDTLTLIEVKSRINEDTIYRIYALSHLIGEQPKERKRLRLVCAGKSLKYSTQELASKLGVETLIIPPKLYHSFVPTCTISKEIPVCLERASMFGGLSASMVHTIFHAFSEVILDGDNLM